MLHHRKTTIHTHYSVEAGGVQGWRDAQGISSTMEGRPLALAFSNHCSENALSSVGGGVEGGGGGGVAVMMMPQADTISSTALNLSTYTAGEDAGRLALLAKEFGLAKIRPPKRQIRKHTFKVRIEINNFSYLVCVGCAHNI